jgi:hypothetical protein
LICLIICPKSAVSILGLQPYDSETKMILGIKDGVPTLGVPIYPMTTTGLSDDQGN